MWGIFQALSLWDGFAFVWFFMLWIGYTWYAKYRGSAALLRSVNHLRKLWMIQVALREQRVVDGTIIENLLMAPSFFASTTIIIVGGLLAMFGAQDKITQIFSDVPFLENSSSLIFDIKLMLLLAIFIFAFFRFSWAVRQYTFAAIAIGAFPGAKEFQAGKYDINDYAQPSSVVLSLAAEAFNAGIRAYYFAFAAVCWFFSPLIFILVSVLVVLVLYWREFRSDVLRALAQVPRDIR